MSFPLSHEVNVGDATEASQYNNLRRDALYLGGEPGASGSLAQLLAQGMGKPALSMVSATTVKLSASASNPFGLMIGGQIYAAAADVTLMINSYGMTSPGRYGLWAVGQSDGSISLSAGASGPDNSRQIGTFLWDGSGIIPGTLKTMAEYEAMAAVNVPQTVNGRLTLASGIPVPEDDITTADELYFTPYGGNEISLRVGSVWELFTFSQLELDLSGLSNGMPYDVFIGVSRNGLSLSASSWGSVPARSSALVYVDGVRCSSMNTQLRYLGTIVKNSAGHGEDSATGRLLYNEYNRVPRPLLSVLDSSLTPTIAMNYWVPYYNEDAPRVRILAPNADTELELTGVGMSTTLSDSDTSSARAAAVGICRDMAMTAPYAGNANCAPVGNFTFGNAPVTVSVRNFGAGFRGYHTYTLAFWTNYSSVKPAMLTFNSGVGSAPGLFGSVLG